jgi:very-short-patch-repair endonuclease
MFSNEKTKTKFGYDVQSLSRCSRKKIIASCDYCEKDYETIMKNYNSGRVKLPKDCCYNCRAKKRAEISIAKHGVANPFQRQDVKDKIKQTSLQKYGVEHPMQNKDIQEKSKATCIEKYGTEFAIQSQEVQDNYKKTCMEKYGVENTSSVEEFKEKRKETNKKLYGHEYYVASQDCKDKVRAKFGVDNVFQLEEVKAKSRETCLTKYGAKNYLQVPEHAKINGQKSLKTKIDNGYIETRDGMSKTEWAEEVGMSKSRFTTLVNTHGWDYAISHEKTMTGIERLIFDFLKEKRVEFSYNKKLDNYYPDFVIPTFNLIIETDGMFWHSDKIQKDDRYHIKKKGAYTELGYTSLFFLEDELLNKFNIVESIINNKLFKSTKIFARKLQVGKMGSSLSKTFFNENHLMGNGQGDTYTLHDGKVVVCAMRVRRRKGNNWDISRFCPKIGYSIPGGFSRLLKAFELEHNPDSVSTFIDKRYGSGEYLTSLNFSLKSCYKSFKWTNGNSTFHRMKFPSNTGYEYGMSKIWDCGQAKYVKSYD